MKKIAMVLSIFMIVCLCSCASKPSREILRDNPSTEIREALHLDDVQNGVSLNSSLDKSKEYADVKIATNPSESLFYQTIDLDEYMGQRFKQINLKICFFNGRIPTSDVTAFMQEMNHTEYGITEEKVGFSFEKTESITGLLFEKLSISYGISLPKGYEKKDNDPAKLVVAYLPTYCTYNDGTQDCTKVFIFVPVYYAFVYSSTLNDYTKGMKNYPLVMTEEGLLPSQSSED
ncbi:MAG: hypothetical protein K2N64_06775 [Anaeroplasmataceae bacterium]|nr:hypothetical protein [Anaeroplasmataceae bacterium]